MKERKTKFYHSLITISFLAVVMYFSVVKLNTDPQIPMILGCVVASLIALKIGYSWNEILDSMLKGIGQSLESILILLSIGILVSVLISCGAVPTMIYYGLKLINARYFLITTFLICSIVSMALGSWGTAGTMGIALMGIGVALEIPRALTAGAIISGAYIGDKISPISDGTNLAAAVANCSVFEAVRQMFGFVIKVFTIVGVIYLFIGFRYGGVTTTVISSVEPLLETLNHSFIISPITLTPFVIILVSILIKIPAIPSIFAGAASGFVLAVVHQDFSIESVVGFCYSGFTSETGLTVLDEVLTAGGMESMLFAVSLIIIAMAFGGIMQNTNQMRALVNPAVKNIRSIFGLTALTVLTCVCVNVILPDQYLGIALPGQMYSQEYKKRGLDPRLLANTLGAGGAVTSPLVPWNTCGVYMSTVLGVSALQYSRYAYFNLFMPVLMIVHGLVLSIKAHRTKASS